MKPPGKPRPKKLSPRQREVLQEYANGRTTAEIAVKLGIATATVRTHSQSIITALQVHTKLQAVVEGARLGFITVPRPD